MALQYDASQRNSPRDFDDKNLWPEKPYFQEESVQAACKKAQEKAKTETRNIEELLKIVSYIDLTTLSGDDTDIRATNLAARALKPLASEILQKLQSERANSITCGAVCTYPARVPAVVKVLREAGDKKCGIASVAGGFPSGQYRLESRLLEIKLAIEDGATEIDTVINRAAALDGNWKYFW